MTSAATPDFQHSPTASFTAERKYGIICDRWMPTKRLNGGMRKTFAITARSGSNERIPSNMLEYTTGSDMRNVISTESCAELTHISASIVNDATGTALTAVSSGANSFSKNTNFPLNMANTIPVTVPSRNPSIILPVENQTLPKNALSGISSMSRITTSTGDASSRLLFTAAAAACHTASQNTTAQKVYSLLLLFSFIAVYGYTQQAPAPFLPARSRGDDRLSQAPIV